MPSENEFPFLCLKFEDKTNGDSIQTITTATSKVEASKDVNMAELIDKIRAHVNAHANLIRISELFQNMDPLNSNLVTKNQFVNCLSSFEFNINRAQIQALFDAYEDQDDRNKVNWKQFEYDVLKSKSLKISADNRQTFIENLRSWLNERLLNVWPFIKELDILILLLVT